MFIPITERVIPICHEVLLKLRVFYDGLVIGNEIFFEFIHRIDTHIDVVVESFEVHSSVSF